MSRGWLWTVALFVVSGCLGGADPAGTSSPSSGAPVVTEELGAIEVTVVDRELNPVQGAQVIVAETDRTGVTDDLGQLAFVDLPAGPYTVLAAKAGFRPAQPQGIVVDVAVAEVTKVSLSMDVVPVVSVDTSYAETLIFHGFISCSAEWIRVAVLVNRTQCGKGVNAGATSVGADPNENATHPWELDNVQIQSIVLEASWDTTVGALGGTLYFATQSAFTCAVTSCQYSNEVQGVGGSSPLRVITHEGPEGNITKFFGGSAGSYPQPIWTTGRAFCGGGCMASVTFQQTYEVLVTAFYGVPAPQDWSALPPG